MKKYLTNKEVKEELVNLLQELHDYLIKNNIKYSIIAGTLLGAVRHKGFIPWDDDIDIILVRDEYEKLLSLLRESNNQINDHIVVEGFELGNDDRLYLKAIDTKIKIEDYSVTENAEVFKLDHLFVDIFCFDNTPVKCFVKPYYLYMYKILGHALARKLREKNNWPYRAKHKIHDNLNTILYSKYSFEDIANKRIKWAKKFNGRKSKYIMNNTSGTGKYELEAIPREVMDDIVEYDFENIKVCGIRDYNAFLSARYGDYMKLPPENQRISHGIIAWREVPDEK